MNFDLIKYKVGIQLKCGEPPCLHARRGRRYSSVVRTFSTFPVFLIEIRGIGRLLDKSVSIHQHVLGGVVYALYQR